MVGTARAQSRSDSDEIDLPLTVSVASVGDLPMDIETLDSRSVSDDQVEKYRAFVAEMVAERTPDESPYPLGAAEAELRQPPSYWAVKLLVVTDGPAWVAVARVVASATDPKGLRLDLGVLPSHRRRGTASSLLRRVLDLAEADGRELLAADAFGPVPAGAAFARWLGAEAGLENHVNRLPLADVDREMVKSWIADGPRRAPGYELVGFDGRCPEELVEPMAAVIDAMSDAPQDPAAAPRLEITPEIYRIYEESLLVGGLELWTLLALESGTGGAAGGTDVRWKPHQPEQMEQGITVVLRQHRGHALGKWLKAAMLQRILEERPGVKQILTANADSNAAMLGINTELGYRPYLASNTWHVSVAAAREALNR